MTKTKRAMDLKEAKRQAVAARLTRIQDNLDVLSGMWDEQTLDILIVILGIGRVEVSDDADT